MKRMTRRGLALTLVCSLLFLLSWSPGGFAQGETAEASDAALAALVAANTQFAFDLYRVLREDSGNLFFSPYSISSALAIAYAGARGETETQMAEVLHFATLGQDGVHPAFNALARELASRGEDVDDMDEEARFRLHVANALWGQDGYSFIDEFLAILTESYGAGIRTIDFAGAPEQARETINQWVSDETEGRIEDLLPPGSVDALTRLVLANAITFNATWEYGFDPLFTWESPFTLLDGSQVPVQMMEQVARLRYAAGEGYCAVELPYVGGELSMLVLLPEIGAFETFTAALDSQRLTTILATLSEDEPVSLQMPRFEVTSEFEFTELLADLGMTDAFVFGDADFSGMDGTRDLSLGGVFHKALVSVDENGTEAAAATAVPIPCALLPTIHLDHPFVFLIRDMKTGAILFVGQVNNPSEV